MCRSHTFGQSGNGFKISPYLQNMLLATTAEHPYQISSELLSMYLGIDINEMQLYRVTDHYGKSLQQVLDNTETLYPVKNKEEIVYAMADGSMILTRENGAEWKETKVGRIFRAEDCLQPDGKTGKITQSQYVSHFGDCRAFTKKMDKVLDGYGSLGDRLIFITDGAIWLRNWIEDAYPDAICILDFYHAKEYLCDFAKDYFKDETVRSKWIEQQEENLQQSLTSQIINTVKSLNKKRKTESGKKLILYYEDNISRMDYKYYKTIGKGIIGSGAIESAHRTVVQSRMKRSGQLWSKKGADHMLCLRTIKMNRQWHKVITMVTEQYHYTNVA